MICGLSICQRFYHLTQGYVILSLALPSNTKKKQTFLSARLNIALLFLQTARRLFFFTKKSMIELTARLVIKLVCAPLFFPAESRYWQARASLNKKLALTNSSRFITPSVILAPAGRLRTVTRSLLLHCSNSTSNKQRFCALATGLVWVKTSLSQSTVGGILKATGGSSRLGGGCSQFLFRKDPRRSDICLLRLRVRSWKISWSVRVCISSRKRQFLTWKVGSPQLSRTIDRQNSSKRLRRASQRQVRVYVLLYLCSDALIGKEDVLFQTAELLSQSLDASSQVDEEHNLSPFQLLHLCGILLLLAASISGVEFIQVHLDGLVGVSLVAMGGAEGTYERGVSAVSVEADQVHLLSLVLRQPALHVLYHVSRHLRLHLTKIYYTTDSHTQADLDHFYPEGYGYGIWAEGGFGECYLYIRMEQQHNYEAEIAAIEESCTRKTAENHQLEAAVATIEQQLEGLLAQINAIKLPEEVPNCQTLKDELAHLTQQRQELEKKLHAEQQYMKGSAITQTSQLQELKQTKAHLQEQTKAPFILSRTELDAASDEIAKVKKMNEGLQNGLEKEESQIAALIQASELLDQQLSSIATLQQGIEVSLSESKLKEDESTWLLELQTLENELAGITAQVQQENEKQLAKATALKKQTQDAATALSEKKTKSDLLAQQSSRLKVLLQNTTKEAANSTQHNATIQHLEKENHGKQSVLESLKRNAERLRDQILKEEKRIRDEHQRAAKQRNYKELTAKARTEHDALVKQRERQQNILDSTLKTKATYLPRENLLILQRELQRHNRTSSASLEGKTSRCEKLQKTNKQLGQGIRRLKTLSFQAQTKEERALNEVKQRGNQLATNQLQLQKEAAEKAFKLNQYIKNFQTHDQEKQQKKKATMRLKKTESVMSEIPVAPKEKKEEAEQFIILDDEMPEPQSRASQNFKKTKWYKRRSSHDLQLPDIPLYQNRYFQAAILLFFLLFLAIFSL